MMEFFSSLNPEAGWIKRENLMVRIFRIKALVFPRKRGEENGSPFQLP
jgi:hypothetical protein